MVKSEQITARISEDQKNFLIETGGGVASKGLEVIIENAMKTAGYGGKKLSPFRQRLEKADEVGFDDFMKRVTEQGEKIKALEELIKGKKLP